MTEYASDSQARTLHYRTAGKTSFWASVIIVGIITAVAFAVSTALVLVELHKHPTRFPTFGSTLGLLNLIQALFWAALFWKDYEKFDKTVQAQSDRLVITTRARKKEYFYRDIRYLKTTRFGFSIHFSFFSWLSFNGSLERLDYVLEAIYAARKDLLSKEKYEALHRKILSNDHGTARSFEVIQNKAIVRLGIMVTGIASLSLVLIQSQSIRMDWSDEFIWAWSHFFFAAAVLFAIVTRIKHRAAIIELAQRRENNWADKKRNRSFEKKFDHFAKPIALSVFISFAWFYSSNALNLISWETAEKDIQEIGIKRGESVFYDRRYNCIDCRFAVKKGDFVVIADLEKPGRRILVEVLEIDSVPTRTLADVTTENSPLLQVKRVEHDHQITVAREKQIIGKFVF